MHGRLNTTIETRMNVGHRDESAELRLRLQFTGGDVKVLIALTWLTGTSPPSRAMRDHFCTTVERADLLAATQATVRSFRSEGQTTQIWDKGSASLLLDACSYQVEAQLDRNLDCVGFTVSLLTTLLAEFQGVAWVDLLKYEAIHMVYYEHRWRSAAQVAKDRLEQLSLGQSAPA
ncbi:hypothetical protein HY375_02850 [Candidatus Berkelbacteria bacterium]|nr:hypothetical protein [Candidatus Berkelbacteria bacterium]